MQTGRLIIVAVALALSGVAQATPAPVHHIPGRVLLKLKPTAAKADVVVDTAALKALGDRHGLSLSLVKPSVLGWIVVDMTQAGTTKVPNEALTLEFVARIAHDDVVMAASENRWARAFATPNDPSFSQMWNLSVANLPQAWDDEQGNTAQRVGIVDTGIIRTHEDVGAKAVVGFDFISNPQTAGDGNGRDADFSDNGDACNGSNSSFHGTHVAGTIAAFTDNGVGIAGINWNAKLAVVRALGRCGGDIVDIMEGALWLAGGQVNGVPAIGADRVKVMNLSLGSQGNCSAFEQDAVSAIDAAGVVFVAAAGNDSGPVNSPANCTGVVTVAAHGPNKALAPYSSFGGQVDIVAPGGDLRNFGTAGGVLSSLGPTNSGYGFFEGTSMAAPHVTGVISLMQAKDPSVNRQKAEQALIASGQSCTGCSGKLALNASGALAQLVRGGTPPVDPPLDPPPALSDDALEENDVAGAAQRLRCGETRSLVALPRDQDWFFVDVDAGPLAVSITGGQTDLDLYIVRNDTEILLRSEGGTGDEALNADVTRTQRIQILVNPFADANSAASGPYTLSLSCTAGADAPPPPPLDPTDPPPVDPTDPPAEPTDPDTPTDPANPTDPAPPTGGAGGLGSPPGAAGGCAATPAAPGTIAVLLLLRRRRRR